MKRVALATVTAVASLTLAGCGSSSSGGAGVAATNANGCTKAPALTAAPQTGQYHHAPPMTIARTTYTATIVTNCGTITIALNGKKAPHTVNSFSFLAAKGYFTDTPCHRLTTSGIYVLQCGDPSGTGTGGPGYEFKDENLAGAQYTKGVVAMANSGPNTNGSQFFLVYADSTGLSANYTPFGTVTSGMDVLQRIAKAGSTPPGDGKPNQPVVIERFTVTKGQS